MAQPGRDAADQSTALARAGRTSHAEGDPELEREQGGRIPCPVCAFPIGAVRGSKAAICANCGFKDGCC